MNTSALIDEFIKNIDPEEVPIEFIKSLIVTDFDGMRRTLTGDQIVKFIADPESFHVSEAKIVLNVYKMKRAVLEEITDLYDDLSRRYNRRH